MDSRISQSIAFMKANLNFKLLEIQIAERARMTPQHFCALFRKETGKPPMHYMKKLRMEKAKELLISDEHSHLTVKEIAALVGCYDLSHFVRDFQKEFGFSPKRYRATNRTS